MTDHDQTPVTGRTDRAVAHRPSPALDDKTTDHERDIEEIKRIISDVEIGFNSNDPGLSVEHFARNGSAVDVAGALLSGREALLEANREGLPGPLRDQFARFEVGDVIFLRPDVAVTHKRAWATTVDGEPKVAGHSMIALYVFVREDGRWWIAARQNTLVAS